MTAVIENQRLLHEELERLEQGVADRLADDPKNIRERLLRDHEIGHFLNLFQSQSQRLLDIYKDEDKYVMMNCASKDVAPLLTNFSALEREIHSLTHGDPFDEFYKQLRETKDFHRRYPNSTVEDLERMYKRRPPMEGQIASIDNMFTGEEFHGRFFDLTQLHEEYLNLKGAKRLTYLQYLASFDKFAEIPRNNKNDGYFTYLTNLAKYLDDFLTRTRPLEDPQSLYEKYGKEFDKAWEEQNVPGWNKVAGPVAQSASSSSKLFCSVCNKAFDNPNTYGYHMASTKHLKAVEKANSTSTTNNNNSTTAAAKESDITRLKDRAIAEREYRVQKLTEFLSKEREDTLTNVERKASLTERERQAELDQLFQESFSTFGTSSLAAGDDDDDDDEEKIYNPLKLPLAWDGKPIPYWLYKLHGLGVEHTCEICGNFVYMGRRAFDKHFTEARHTHGLRCLGVTNTTLFREITGIEDALKLNEKLKVDKKKSENQQDNIIQMEDAEGNVMPAKVYYDLQKQGLL